MKKHTYAETHYPLLISRLLYGSQNLPAFCDGRIDRMRSCTWSLQNFFGALISSSKDAGLKQY